MKKILLLIFLLILSLKSSAQSGSINNLQTFQPRSYKVKNDTLVCFVKPEAYMVLKQLKKIPLYKETINHMDSIIDYQEKNIEYRDSIRAINSDHENSLNSKLNECNQEYIKQNKQLKKKSRISNYKNIALLILITILVLR